MLQAKHISYYVGWVEQYLVYAESHQDVPESQRIAGFLVAVKNAMCRIGRCFKLKQPLRSTLSNFKKISPFQIPLTGC
jgi:hypothetical protein